jgi:murein DD-endopeptidase MepM/ murein hydrolase activator NlpD
MPGPLTDHPEAHYAVSSPVPAPQVQTGEAPSPWEQVRRFTTIRSQLGVAFVRGWVVGLRSDNALRSRLISHGVLILLAVMALVLSRADLRPRATAEAGAAQGEIVGEQPPVLPVEGPAPMLEQGVLVRAAVPHTIIPERPRETITRYTVQFGDTIFGIAEQFGLKPDTVVWANPPLEDNPDLLRVGQELVILPIDGVYHEVQPGDTLEKVARQYKVEPQVVIDYLLNNLDKENPRLIAGEHIIVPGGIKPYIPRVVHAYSGPVPADAEKGTGIFGWPTSGRITQGYWNRHRAIDIGAPKGTAVYAADSGWVANSGWSDIGYGYFILIDHGNGFQTLYAHLSAIDVEAGTSVAKGTRIGAVGATGNATGPHLHFEIRKSGVQRNPFGFLP